MLAESFSTCAGTTQGTQLSGSGVRCPSPRVLNATPPPYILPLFPPDNPRRDGAAASPRASFFESNEIL